MKDLRDTKIAFFGGEPLAIPVLQELKTANILPNLIVCNPDRPAGRGKQLTPPPVKTWTEEHQLKTFQPESYKNKKLLAPLLSEKWDLFVVVAYNFILPKWLLDFPTHGVINVHPSLLPKLRGPSPIRTAIKDDLKEAVGASIMLMDEKMDHGPILTQKAFDIDDEAWPIPGPALDESLGNFGGSLLAETIPRWIHGEITPSDQHHEKATYTERFTKEDFELSLNPKELPIGIEAKAALHHIYAFAGIGDSYFIYNDTRVKIKRAELTKNGSLRPLRVTPAGKSEMDFEQYLQSIY